MTNQHSNSRKLVIFSIVILALIIMLSIINYSISQTISWSLYPIGALIMIWATFAPTDLPKYKLLGSFLGFSFSIFPFLYLIATLSGNGSWFWPLAVPLACSLIVTLGIFFFLILQLKNKWFTVAAAFFLFGVFLNFIVGVIIQRYLASQNMKEEMYNHVTLFGSLLISIFLILIGMRTKNSY